MGTNAPGAAGLWERGPDARSRPPPSRDPRPKTPGPGRDPRPDPGPYYTSSGFPHLENGTDQRFLYIHPVAPPVPPTGVIKPR
ncbi:hypothetical protein J1605_002178 [Eschrichtius robustus]|uniref:Uncharacterized protein n=1 Tax=Eschrichtius robustus TaxID=9764 RepID=A0AB34I0B4_ESCRO|nr:hypothetical protein J1605_002178 [Eschrichtius robustus]